MNESTKAILQQLLFLLFLVLSYLKESAIHKDANALDGCPKDTAVTTDSISRMRELRSVN